MVIGTSEEDEQLDWTVVANEHADPGTLEQAVARISPGVIGLTLERSGERVGSGTGFLIPGFVVTASHVLRTVAFDTLRVELPGAGADQSLRLPASHVLRAIRFESSESEHDLALLELDELEFADRYRFELAEEDRAAPGQQVLLLGYPYDSSHLTAHVGFISAAYASNVASVLQLDASVNPSNSGGPVVDPQSLKVIGYIVRAQTGLMDDFDALVGALEQNIAHLSQQRATISIGGVDPVEGLRVTMASMRILALNMKRSANVGIGYAYAASHLRAIVRSSR